MWYELSNKHIAKELVDAKRRGLDVKICLGKSMLYAAADALQELVDEVVMLNMSAFEKNIEDIVFFRSLEARVYTNIFAAVG
ncbi:hypothetical protein PI124_g2958 [Phytophthora idaei]|nr:hypothetical protein PI124_g2958 [Phytophthora idaei]